jgi:hypothetical protein
MWGRGPTQRKNNLFKKPLPTRECVPPPYLDPGGTHLLAVEGVGGANSDDRLGYSCTLYTLCLYPFLGGLSAGGGGIVLYTV